MPEMLDHARAQVCENVDRRLQMWKKGQSLRVKNRKLKERRGGRSVLLKLVGIHVEN